MSRATAALGSAGEALVAAHLVRQGFAIVAQNVRVGRLELDLIARRGSLLVFCEVRTRSTNAFIDPILTIDRRKCARIRKAASQWLARQREQSSEVRFDAASVVIDGDRQELAYYEDAF